MIEIEEIKRRYALHWLIWNNCHKELLDVLEENENGKQYHVMRQEDLEKKDSRGRTPLMLAVTLGHFEAVKALLDANANVNCERDGWTAVQEATAAGDPEILALVLEHRDRQRHSVQAGGVPDLLRKLADAPDFYVEMKWEFTSWVPLVLRMCPSDTLRVYKQGSKVRLDTTLLGFDQNKWQRGNKSYIFRGEDDGATMIELDHETSNVWVERMESSDDITLGRMPTEEMLRQRLTAPICTNYLETDKICFERSKCGIWGWRSDRNEEVCGYNCKVFSASDVEIVSKTRSEHLSTEHRRASSTSINPIRDLLALQPDKHESNLVQNPSKISPEEYFSEDDLGNRDIGRPKEIVTKLQKFKATLWLSESYPLELQEQIMPILDLMASLSSPHFIKLKHFIQMQLPSGFPVKIEIPLFHVLNARITFCNIFGTETPVKYVECIDEGDRLSCVLDEMCFQIPPGYRDIAHTQMERRMLGGEDEDELLQYAIEQSLLESGTENDQVDIWEALRADRPSRPATPSCMGDEEQELQRAIAASLESAAAELRQEQAQLHEALKLSLVDK